MNDDEELLEQVNLDELYERRREIQEQKEAIYKRILSRILKKIKTTSRLKHEEQFCFYVIPDVVIGFPRYDVRACIKYVIEKLEENKLFVKYTHPNMLFISWQHYIPTYERKDIKKRTGVQIDGFGNVVNEHEQQASEFDDLTRQNTIANAKPKPDFKKTSAYKPLGIYNEDMVRRINEKIN
jgi:hypothetical protein